MATKAALWPRQKLRVPAGNGKRAVLLTTGGMNPVHRGHVALLEQAAARLAADGWDVCGAYLSPSHDLYVQPKARSLNTLGLSAAFRTAIAEKTLEAHPTVDIGRWEAAQRGRWPDFPEVCVALRDELQRAGVDATVFYCCGGDHGRKCGLLKRTVAAGMGTVVVPREGDRKLGAEAPERLIYVAEPCGGDVATFSSTKVRAALKAGDTAYLTRALSKEAARFLLSPTAAEYAQFAKEYAKVGVKGAGAKTVKHSEVKGIVNELAVESGESIPRASDTNAASGGEGAAHRVVYISLSSLLRKCDGAGGVAAVVSSIPLDALLCFGSKRSWVFPADDQERRESQRQNKRYTAPQYQGLRDLILAKETRGEVFFLKPPGFEYNGCLDHGDPDAFARLSDWLVQHTNPATGAPYNPLHLDTRWWRDNFDARSAKHCSSPSKIVSNFKHGAHDYGAMAELLVQENPGLEVRM